jgi:hypothetical protein
VADGCHSNAGVMAYGTQSDHHVISSLEYSLLITILFTNHPLSTHSV